MTMGSIAIRDYNACPGRSPTTMAKDLIYQQREGPAGSFEFSAAVAEVFPDMLRRSIPGYDVSIAAIGALAGRFVRPDTRCYDLGCSLGAASAAMQDNISVPGCEIIAIDQAPAMVERCREHFAARPGQATVEIREADIRDVAIENASMVAMNYTLQFLPPGERLGLLMRICAGMIPGGVFVLSEKVVHDDEDIEALLVGLHHDFKRANAYSDLEISRKRTALENVLVPETTDTHLKRMKNAGFGHAEVWLKHFNFLSIVAIR